MPNTLKLACILVIFSPLVFAQSQPTTDVGAANLEITITGVEGMVQVRDAEDKPWRKAVVGAVVGPGAEFRTGPKSAVRCQIPPDQTFTIDRLGVMKVLTALRQQGGKVRTDLLMPYGRTRYDIEDAGVEHQSTIRSPSSTLAIRGTRVSLYDQPPFTPRAISLTGRAVYANAKKQIAFGGKGQGKTDVAGNSNSAAETAAAIATVEKVIDPKSAIELTQQEAQQLAFEVTQGGIRYDRLIVGGFKPPPDDLAALGLLPGKLNFVATWTGFADVDLFVIVNPNTPQQMILGNPSVSTVLPGTVKQQLPSGARIDFDKVSTQQGDYEVAYWPEANYKGGVFGVGIIHHDFRSIDPDYSNSSKIKLEVYVDGKKIKTVVVNPEDITNNDADPIFGTTYSAQTNLAKGRDVLSTLAIVPDPKGSTRGTAAVKTTKVQTPTPVMSIPPSRRSRENAEKPSAKAPALPPARPRR